MDNQYSYPNLSNIPQELQGVDQWVCWIASPDKSGKKPKKLPINPRTGNMAITTNPGTWGTWEEATMFYKKFQGQPY